MSSAISSPAGASSPTRIVAVTSGKGGVGKTSVSVNLAVALARAGARVCVLDADTGLANINILLGLAPRYTLEHVFNGERQLSEILLHGPGGVDIIPGASGLVSHVNPDVQAQKALVQGLQSLEQRYDYLLIDTAAGISATVLHFVASAQSALVVITPEPTSLTDAFSLLKVLRQKGYRRTVQVVVNMVADSRQAWKIYQRFNQAVEKYIGLQTQWLASIPRDDAMQRATMIQNPATISAPSRPASVSFAKMSQMLEQYFTENRVPNSVFSRYWQRVFERVSQRMAAQGQATTQPETNKTAPSKVSVLPSQQSRAQSKAAVPGVDDIPEPDSGVELERRWGRARAELISLIEQDQVTPDQLLQLLGEIVDASGDAVTQYGVDLAYFLLSRCEPSQVGAEQRQLLDLELFRLGVRNQTPVPVADGVRFTAVDTGSVAAMNAANQPLAPLPVSSNSESRRKHGFDEAGFGSQEELLRRLKEASNGESLTSLLASLRHASLVRKDQASL